MSEVRLVDLEIFKRYSLAIRQETASAEELLAVLDASRDVIAASLRGKAAASRKPRTKKSTA